MHGCVLRAGLFAEVHHNRHDRSLKGCDLGATCSRYDAQAESSVFEMFRLVVLCFSSARVAVVRLSLALS